MSNPITVFFIITALCVVMLILVLVGGHQQRVKQQKFATERALNPLLPFVPPRYTAKQARNYRLGYLAIFLSYVFISLVPSLYERFAEIPPFENLHETVGEFTYEVTGKHGEDRLTGIKTSAGTLYFSCGPGSISHPDCVSPSSEYDRLSGKTAQVWWYEQPTYLFTTQNRVVKLVVDGKEKRSYNDTVEITKSVANSAPWLNLIFLSVYILFIIALEQHLRKGLKPQIKGLGSK